MFEGRNGLWLNWKPSFISLYLYHAISNIIIPLLCGKSSTLYVLFLLPSMKKCHKFVYDTSCKFKWLSFAPMQNCTCTEHIHNSKCSCSWFFVQCLFYAYKLTKKQIKKKAEHIWNSFCWHFILCGVPHSWDMLATHRVVFCTGTQQPLQSYVVGFHNNLVYAVYWNNKTCNLSRLSSAGGLTLVALFSATSTIHTLWWYAKDCLQFLVNDRLYA